jgi:hypothetical protein
VKIEIEIDDRFIERAEAAFNSTRDTDAFRKTCGLAILSAVGTIEFNGFRQARSHALQQELEKRQQEINAELGLGG